MEEKNINEILNNLDNSRYDNLENENIDELYNSINNIYDF